MVADSTTISEQTQSPINHQRIGNAIKVNKLKVKKILSQVHLNMTQEYVTFILPSDEESEQITSQFMMNSELKQLSIKGQIEGQTEPSASKRVITRGKPL